MTPTASKRLDDYLERYRQRLRQLNLAKGLALFAVVALVISLLAVALAIHNGFPTQQMISSRLFLAVVLGAVIYFAIVVPARRIAEAAARKIEQRTPAFAGRVEAYVDNHDGNNPLQELLAKETLGIAADHPAETQVGKREINAAAAVAVLAAGALLLIAIAGPGNYAYGVRSLWIGWALPGLLPPQSIEVSPGDGGARLSGNVLIQATPLGFEPREASLHASFADGEWQTVPMPATGDGFEFTFFSVRQPLEYYVSAANVRSPTYTVQIVDVPNVTNLALTIHYPEWTGREPQTLDPGGDVRAIADAQIEVSIRTDRPMTPGELVVDSDGIELDIDGSTASATFTVQKDGQYFSRRDRRRGAHSPDR